MSASLTLMPALLSKIGGRIKPAKGKGDGRRRRAKPASRRAGAASSPVARCPWPMLALVVLLALALPALHIRLASSDASTYKKGDTTRIAYDLLKKGFGAGLQRAAAARRRAAEGR